MLDERTSALLEKINELCKEGGFKIAEEGELLGCLPQASSGEDLKRMLSYLEERRYIDVRYAEEGVYCLCPLPEGRLYAQSVREARRENVRRRTGVLFTSALGGFLGAFLGALLVWLIFFARGI